MRIKMCINNMINYMHVFAFQKKGLYFYITIREQSQIGGAT